MVVLNPPAKTYLAWGILLDSLRIVVRWSRAWKTLFYLLHMGCPGMRLRHQVRVPSLPPSLQTGMGLQAATQLAKCSIYIQTITFPCLGFIWQSFCKRFALIRHHDQHVLTRTVTLFHTLNHPHVYHHSLARCNSLVQAGVSQEEKKINDWSSLRILQHYVFFCAFDIFCHCYYGPKVGPLMAPEKWILGTLELGQ